MVIRLDALTGVFNGRGRTSKQTGGNTVCPRGTLLTAGGGRRRKVDVLPRRQQDRAQSVLVTFESSD